MQKSLQAMVVGASAAMATLPSDGADLLVPSQYPTIQAAINAASNGDVVRVSPGTYGPFWIEGKSITVIGQGDGVVVDAELAQRAVVVSSVSGPEGVTLQGLDLTRGFAFASGEAVVGGGVLVTNATVTLNHVSIRNCELTREGGSFFDESGGGGLAAIDSTLVMVDCLVIGNKAWSTNTGNTYASAAVLGGGLFAKQSAVTVTNCEFLDNRTHAATTGTSWHNVLAVGGGIAVRGGSVDIWGGMCVQNECKAENETSGVASAYASGGGIYLESAVGILRGMRVEQNVAVVESVTTYSDSYNSALGGGVAVWDCSTVDLEDCDITTNIAVSGLFADGWMHGGGVWVRGTTVEVTESVIQGNGLGLPKSTGSRQGGAMALVEDATVFIRSTAACGNDVGQVFVDGGAQLTVESSCLESDCGDCEDCDSSGVADLLEILDGTLADADGNNIPDICECMGDLNGNGAVDGADISVMLGFWGENPAPYPAADINADGFVNGSDLAEILGNWGPCQ